MASSFVRLAVGRRLESSWLVSGEGEAASSFSDRWSQYPVCGRFTLAFLPSCSSIGMLVGGKNFDCSRPRIDPIGRQTCTSLHSSEPNFFITGLTSTGSGSPERSWNVGKLSLQTSPRVREGILGHHRGNERKGDGVRNDNGVAAGKEGNARMSKSENSGIGSSGGVSGK